MLNGAPFSVHYVRRHDSAECESLLRELAPDTLVLGGTDILPERILRLASRGTLNCHPGLLPDYRGCSCVEWAVYNDDPVGATCHTVTSKIDWGSVVYSEAMPPRRQETYPELRARMIAHQTGVMTRGLKRFLQKKKSWPAMKGKGRYWKTIGAAELACVKEKLAKGEYRIAAEKVHG